MKLKKISQALILTLSVSMLVGCSIPNPFAKKEKNREKTKIESKKDKNEVSSEKEKIDEKYLNPNFNEDNDQGIILEDFKENQDGLESIKLKGRVNAKYTIKNIRLLMENKKEPIVIDADSNMENIYEKPLFKETTKGNLSLSEFEKKHIDNDAAKITINKDEFELDLKLKPAENAITIIAKTQDEKPWVYSTRVINKSKNKNDTLKPVFVANSEFTKIGNTQNIGAKFTLDPDKVYNIGILHKKTKNVLESNIERVENKYRVSLKMKPETNDDLELIYINSNFDTVLTTININAKEKKIKVIKSEIVTNKYLPKQLIAIENKVKKINESKEPKIKAAKQEKNKNRRYARNYFIVSFKKDTTSEQIQNFADSTFTKIEKRISDPGSDELIYTVKANVNPEQIEKIKELAKDNKLNYINYITLDYN